MRAAAVIGLAAAASLAGCGGGPDAPSGTESARTTQRTAFLEVARCMRAHGYPNFPDPVQDEQGRWKFPDSAPQTQTQPPACSQLARRAKSLLEYMPGDGIRVGNSDRRSDTQQGGG